MIDFISCRQLATVRAAASHGGGGGNSEEAFDEEAIIAQQMEDMHRQRDADDVHKRAFYEQRTLDAVELMLRRRAMSSSSAAAPATSATWKAIYAIVEKNLQLWHTIEREEKQRNRNAWLFDALPPNGRRGYSWQNGSLCIHDTHERRTTSSHTTHAGNQWA
jgi:hypothetical protein